MYRGQDIGNRTELLANCVQALESGQIKALYAILPHISVLRSPEFLAPLNQLLETGTRPQKLFAALALGSIGVEESIQPLARVFEDPDTFNGAGTRSLQKAAILSLGEIGHDDSILILLSIYRLKKVDDKFQARRKRLVITALGTLVQHGSDQAEQELVGLLSERQARFRAQAVTELGVAYWNSPARATDSLLEKFHTLTQDPAQEVRNAAHAALLNLADLGSERAERHLGEVIDRQAKQLAARDQ